MLVGILVAAGSVLVAVVSFVRRKELYSDAKGASVVRYVLDSRLLRRRLHEIGVKPAGESRQRRPLLILLHGRNDPGPLDWLTGHKSGPETLLSNALFAGLAQLPARLRPVVVLLDGGSHSYYHDRRDGPWASMILHEAIPDAIRRFHVAPSRIAIGGISMGGYGALHLAALRPSEFCAVGGRSPALWTSSGASAPGAFDDAADFERNDVFAAARNGRFAALPVWIDGGDQDPFRNADAGFVSLLRAHSVAVAYHVWPGSHDEAYWHAHMPAYLRFYARALAACP